MQIVFSVASVQTTEGQELATNSYSYYVIRYLQREKERDREEESACILAASVLSVYVYYKRVQLFMFSAYKAKHHTLLARKKNDIGRSPRSLPLSLFLNIYMDVCICLFKFVCTACWSPLKMLSSWKCTYK